MHASETRQFVAALVPGISHVKEGDVGIVQSALRDAAQIRSKHLGILEAYDAAVTVIPRAESLRREMMQEIERAGISLPAVSRHELAPEHRQESIRSEARNQQQPVQRL
jgi:hypothetical protein